MGMKFPLLLATVALATEIAMAYDCYQCAEVTGPGLTPDKDCSGFPDKKYKGVACTLSGANSCFTMDGKATGKDSDGKEVTYEGTLRGCTDIGKTECLDGTDYVKAILNSLGVSVKDLSYDGAFCICDKENCNGAGAVKPLALLLGVALATKYLLI